jgi:hypothetical protein
MLLLILIYNNPWRPLATTSYLQTKQRIKIYAYLPSHYGQSDMEFEELAQFRKQLLKLKILKEKGMKGVKDFSR